MVNAASFPEGIDMTVPRRSGRFISLACLACALAVVCPGMPSSHAATFQSVAPSVEPGEGSAVIESEPSIASVPETAPAAASAPADEVKQDLEKKRKLRLAILVGGLIAVTGLALVLLTILGGSATRRGLRRKPLSGGPPAGEPLPAERFDESDSPTDDSASPPETEPRPTADGGAR